MIVVIDGNIGCGKSTVLDALSERGFLVHKEAIEMWPLEKFYEDQSRWAFMMQIAVFDSMEPIHAGQDSTGGGRDSHQVLRKVFLVSRLVHLLAEHP